MKISASEHRMEEIALTEKEKAEAGLLYDANSDPQIVRDRLISQELCYDYNMLRPSQIKEREEMIRKHLAKTGKTFLIEQPFHCDFWYRVSIGENFYSNYNLVILAGNNVTFGDNVLIGPDCGIYAAGHPLDVEQRNAGLEYAHPIHIGNNVWIGGGVKIMSGVTIGDNTVIAAGSVVTKDIPSNVLAGGVPCRVIRKLDK